LREFIRLEPSKIVQRFCWKYFNIYRKAETVRKQFNGNNLFAGKLIKIVAV